MLEGVSICQVRARHKPKLCGITISAKGAKLGKAMRTIGPGTKKGFKREGIRGDTRKNIKRMGRDDFRETRDHSHAVPGIGGLKEGSVIG